MAYHRQSLGASAEDIGDAVRAASKLLEDPSLPEVTCHVLRLSRINNGVDPGPPCRPTVIMPSKVGKGIGLEMVTGPLRAFTWARTSPLQALALSAAVVGAIYWFGYQHGRRGRAA